MPTAVLAERAFVSVSGPDAEHLLQSILTTDLSALPEGVAKPGALLTPQGKILFDFLVSRDGADGFVLECRSEIADDFMRRLMLYKLRAKVQIAKRDESLVSISWREESSPSHLESTSSGTDSTALRDARFPEALGVTRRPLAEAVADADISGWTGLRIAHGVAESGSDYALSDAFPHDVLFDQNGGVGLRKGCYVGQEVVSRMHHRGTARRRVLIAEAGADLPEAGTPVLAQGRPAGTLGSVHGSKGLAIVRIDKVKAAMDAGEPVTAGGVELSLSIPPGMGFTFPEVSAGEDA
jgi:hypothetical protein